MKFPRLHQQLQATRDRAQRDPHWAAESALGIGGTTFFILIYELRLYLGDSESAIGADFNIFR